MQAQADRNSLSGLICQRREITSYILNVLSMKCKHCLMLRESEAIAKPGKKPKSNQQWTQPAPWLFFQTSSSPLYPRMNCSTCISALTQGWIGVWPLALQLCLPCYQTNRGPSVSGDVVLIRNTYVGVLRIHLLLVSLTSVYYKCEQVPKSSAALSHNICCAAWLYMALPSYYLVKSLGQQLCQDHLALLMSGTRPSSHPGKNEMNRHSPVLYHKL